MSAPNQNQNKKGWRKKVEAEDRKILKKVKKCAIQIPLAHTQILRHTHAHLAHL